MSRRQQGTPEEKFWSKVERRGPDECWPWHGAHLPMGYGTCNFSTIKGYAHRIAYELTFGPIPESMTIDHLCRNTGCVNPAHFEVVTLRENIRRANGFAGVNARKTHCKNGHPLEGDNLYVWRGKRKCKACRDANLTKWQAAHPEKVRQYDRKKEARRQAERRANPVPKGKRTNWETVCQIRERYANGERQCDLAREYNLGDDMISRIVNYKTWFTPTNFKELDPHRFD